MSKTPKKMLTLMLSMMMVFSLFVPTLAATNSTDYDNHWAKSAIENALLDKIIKGYPNGDFKPDNDITRAEFFTLINKKFNFTGETPLYYSDVPSDAWYHQDVAKAKTAGYVVGYPDGSIQPNLYISRQEVALILSRLKTLSPSDKETNFTDAASIAAWSKAGIGAVNGSGIMVGYPDGSFKPTANIKRAEALVAVSKCFNNIDPIAIAPVVIPPVVTTPVVIPPIVPLPVVTPPVINSPAISPVNLGTAGNFVILSKSGISTVPPSSITGNVGVSPIDSTAITGFSLSLDATNIFSTSTQIIGKAYASDYTAPSPSNLTTAISDMETAYTNAAGRAVSFTELYSGDISGRTLSPGVYKWGTGVLISTDVTLKGGPNDVWIFQIGEGITQASGSKIILSGGAQAKNIFWQAAETVSIGTGAHMEGIILCQTNISLDTNATIVGRLLSQTAVTLDASTVVAP